MVDLSSHYYPYERIYPGNSTFDGIERIPEKIIKYLLDLPDAAGYTPVDDNTRPRVRFIKYLWHDGRNPLGEALPTPAQKLSLLFDPEHPDLATTDLRDKHPKGFRLIGQGFIGQSQTEAATTVKVYMGRTFPKTPFQSELGVVFEILTSVVYETNTKSDAYARTYAMEQAILASLHGVNISGVGCFNFNRTAHSDNGSRPIADKGVNVGRELHMSLTWMDAGAPQVETI